MNKKHYCPGKMANSLKRFFATLRSAQNDNYLSVNGEGVGSSGAASNPFPTQYHNLLSF